MQMQVYYYSPFAFIIISGHGQIWTTYFTLLSAQYLQNRTEQVILRLSRTEQNKTGYIVFEMKYMSDTKISKIEGGNGKKLGGNLNLNLNFEV